MSDVNVNATEENAVHLLAAAERAGLDPSVVRTSNGFLVADKALAKDAGVKYLAEDDNDNDEPVTETVADAQADTEQAKADAAEAQAKHDEEEAARKTAADDAAAAKLEKAVSHDLANESATAGVDKTEPAPAEQETKPKPTPAKATAKAKE